jgi:hypothetical protein
MPPPRSHAVSAIRIGACVTLALYAVVVALIALTIAFPRWGEDPHPARQPGDDFSFYLPPQFTAAVIVLLGAFALAALAGVIAARSGRGQQSGWVVALRALTGLALQGVVLLGGEIYAHVTLPPTLEVASAAVSLLAFLLLPVAVLVSTGGEGTAARDVNR